MKRGDPIAWKQYGYGELRGGIVEQVRGDHVQVSPNDNWSLLTWVHVNHIVK